MSRRSPPVASTLQLLLLAALLITGCDGDKPLAIAGPQTTPPPIQLVDATEAAGLRVTHRSGATAERYLPETMGAGVAIFDADGDQRADIFLVGGLAVAELEAPPAGAPGSVLLRNRGDGTFEDVTAGSGLGAPHLGMGVAVGDLDNDGDLDLVATGVGGDRLFKNRGDGTFEDVTAAMGLLSGSGSGVDDVGFSASALFFDYDRDGWLDLFLCRYVAWSPSTDLPCRPDGQHRSYCTPEAYPGVSNRLYRNRGGASLEDVTAAAGIERADGKALGAAVIDLGDDLWPDLVVANDTARNFFFRNRGDGRFEEVGLELGLALGQSGAPRGAMGIDSGDLDGDLLPDVVIGNFAQEMSAVYRLTEDAIFIDEAARWGVGLPTLMPLAFGVQALDLDLDGWLDLVLLHGHIEPDIQRFQPLQQHAQLPVVFRNEDGRGFTPLPATGALAEPLVGRGLASGDLDGDGDLDLVVTQNGGRARLWRNDAPTSHYLRFQLQGSASNRSGYGARVDVEAGGRTLRRWLLSGRSYLSASEPILTFGLGSLESVDAVRITWPSGQVQNLGPLPIDRLHIITEPVDETSK